MNTLQKAIEQLSNVQGARFVSLTYKAKGTGELARHNILLGVNVEKAYKRDLRQLKRKVNKLQGVAKQACQELIDSLTESLTKGIGENSGYTCKGVYENLLQGVKVHKETNTLYLNGFSRSKVVLEKGEYKEVKSSEKTLEKNKLREKGKLGKFRQFSLQMENLKSVRVNGKTLEIE